MMRSSIHRQFAETASTGWKGELCLVTGRLNYQLKPNGLDRSQQII